MNFPKYSYPRTLGTCHPHERSSPASDIFFRRNRDTAIATRVFNSRFAATSERTVVTDAFHNSRSNRFSGRAGGQWSGDEHPDLRDRESDS